LDFEEFTAEDMVHIGISVKDFRAIVMHAETLKASITALYSHPTLPMQLTYREHGMQCEFTLMTIGDYRSDSATPTPAAIRKASSVPKNRQSSNQSPAQDRPPETADTMLPPVQPASRSFTRELPSQRPPRPLPPPPKASLDPESLFLSSDEEDERKWGEKTFEQEEDTIGWDQSISNVRLTVGILLIFAYEIKGSAFNQFEQIRRRFSGLVKARAIPGMAKQYL
jgi:cell cycle checkpoint control protein RAD9A